MRTLDRRVCVPSLSYSLITWIVINQSGSTTQIRLAIVKRKLFSKNLFRQCYLVHDITNYNANAFILDFIDTLKLSWNKYFL